MRHLLLFFGLLVSTSQLYAWTRTADFEGGVVGDYALGSNALSNRAGQATFSNSFAHSGTRSLKAEVQAGKNAYGGRISLPSALSEGDEIWYRAYWYYPAGFDFTTDAVGLKTMRINTQDSAGNSSGYLSIYRAENGGNIRPHGEVVTKNFNTWLYNNYPGGTTGQVIGTGVWHCLEMYVKFSSVPGRGVYRIWQNGKLVFEDTANQTLGASTNRSTFVLVGNYFNGGASKTQAPYVDDIVITNQRPAQVDSQGNPMIGLVGGAIIAPPNPPGQIN
jgi:hypothetical protein